MSSSGEVGVHFFTETPGHYFSDEVQKFIDQEVYKPNKIWAKQIVDSDREADSVKLRTDEFVLLPDLVAYRRQFKQVEPRPNGLSYYHPKRRPFQPDMGFALKTCARPCKFQPQHDSLCMSGLDLSEFPTPPVRHLNWLAIVTDPRIRTIRDLTGDHLPMLERLYESCVDAITKETGLERQDIMVFANYPPSVYKLHFHFCAPFFKSSAYDGFRIHPLSTIINNLKLFSDYYKLSTFDVPLHTNSELCRVIQARNKNGGED
jgi:hypothetical protein